VWHWFVERFQRPTPPQERGWIPIAAGKSTLIAAPTGSGKTLAAFLWCIDRLVQEALAGRLKDATSVVYVSPLKALGNDIAKNLQIPLAEIYQRARSDGTSLPDIRLAVRSGDTPAHSRQAMVRKPPHILITTPESLYILLTAEKSRRFLKTAETVIIDEIHAVAQDKRGAHLALSVERLEELTGRPLQRIGLSATQKPVEAVARLLVGSARVTPDGRPACEIVDFGHQRELNLRVELPDQELGAVATHEMWGEIYEKIIAHVMGHRTTLVFVNTRRFVERVAHQLSERLGAEKVGAHHGSLSRKTRLLVEEKLKSGDLPVVVATASLELGIDIGHVDLVCHVGSPRTIGILLQRVGRAGHGLGAIPKGIFFPLTRDDLVQCVAGIRAVRQGELDRLTIPQKPLDVLAQQMTATVAGSGANVNNEGRDIISEDALWSLVKRAYPYRKLLRHEFEQVLQLISEGTSTRRGRRGAYVHRDRVNRVLRPRRGARLAAITNGGAIPDAADYDVIQFPDETFVGKVNEDFAIESLAGDIFLLGNRSWRIRRVAAGKLWVEDAQGLPPNIPFWFGEAPARTRELSAAVADLRQEVEKRLADPAAAKRWVMRETQIADSPAAQIVDYIQQTRAVLGCIPTQELIVAERFFDEAGGMQLVIHSPWGGRINRAWGMALRKRFCVNFDRELQAAATDDGIVISLPEQHSFPLPDVFTMVQLSGLEADLVQAVLPSPFFTNRWRWNATRALAVMRHSGGRKVPVALQRMRAEDMLAAVFPEQVMCQDNRSGPIQVPDHPLVNETLRDCLHEAMDFEGLKKILACMGREEIKTVAIDTPAPSPMAHEILNANPYAFLDNAPLEERRARAVSLRRVDPWMNGEVGRLDPEVIRKVCAQAWPVVRNADELHDLLLSVCLLPLERAPDWRELANGLRATGRAAVVAWSTSADLRRRQAYVAVERLATVQAVLPITSADQVRPLLPGSIDMPASEEQALRRVVLGWMEVLGPTTARELAAMLGLALSRVNAALVALESDGVVLRGRFRENSPGKEEVDEMEWCDRALLARIHRLTLARLRREIEPVSARDFMKFLLAWQHAASGTRLGGREGVLEIIRQLQGLELPAPAWEQSILPVRVEEYDPADLESLCLAGAVTWGRLKKSGGLQESDSDRENGIRNRRRPLMPARRAPLAFLVRDDKEYFVNHSEASWQAEALSPSAREVGRYLEHRGASFLTDIARGTGLLKVKVEEALWELVAHGYVTGDGIAGLRTLLTPERKRTRRRRGLRLISGGRSAERLMPVGRWSLWSNPADRPLVKEEYCQEQRARQLLRRYGIVFRDVLARESWAPSWRNLLAIYRRLEARGEIRGGRFVNGFIGEQFALPEAVDAVRAVRRSPAEQEAVLISSADPLNLLGILTPGARVSPYSGMVIVYKNGQPVDCGPLGAVRSRGQEIPAPTSE
jgi:ATP-dependent Lhr-like helicase